MADVLNETSEIKETDIVFDCPHCGKSLAIDYRGAGLTIPCTDCGKDVVVPIPEGMELTDIDSNEEEQEIRILNLRRSLSAAEFRVEQLESQVADLNARAAQPGGAETDPRLGQAFELLTAMEEQMGSLSKSLEALREALRPAPPRFPEI
jgi:hypothetical protein